VMLLVDDGKLSLDKPLAELLPKPLPAYPPFADLAGDTRWQRLTPRHVLTHSTGFANFAWLEPDKTLRFHFEPGSRYAYSGEGINLLQFVIENGPGIDIGVAMQQRVFDRFGMTRTSMSWRDSFEADVADGYDMDGAAWKHSKRRNVRAAGSMDTTIADQARFWAAAVRGDGLSPASRAEWVRPQLPIASAHQFPSLAAATEVARNERIGLAAGIGVVVFRDAGGGIGWYKGGHDDTTGNIAICIERNRRCVVMLGNDVRAERIYPEIARLVLGPTSMPWTWEYDFLDRPARPAAAP
jgi:CubicO group peptidase (beta-lactamase class C family)